MAAKKAKKAKKGKRKGDEEAPKQELDAVKGFIFVMILLILALGVFLVIKLGERDEARTDLANLRAKATQMRDQSLRIQGYLDRIKDSEETTLLKSPNRFFAAIYRQGDVKAEEKDVRIPSVKDSRNSRDRYTEFYWDIDIKNLNREQAAHFMHMVESRSPKAKNIETSLRRNEKAGEDIWDCRFRVGYRVALAKQ